MPWGKKNLRTCWGWYASQKSWRGDPPKKPTHLNKGTVCANNFGTVCTNCPPISQNKQKRGRKSLRKLFAQTVFIWVGGFLDGLPSLEKNQVGKISETFVPPTSRNGTRQAADCCPYNSHIRSGHLAQAKCHDHSQDSCISRSREQLDNSRKHL